MKIEREIKVKIEYPEEIRRHLQDLGFHRKFIVFERNYVLDTESQTLLSKKQLLRIRYVRNLENNEISWILTFKSPKNNESEYKTMYEYETYIENGEIMLQIFKNLGYKVYWIYEKVRETWVKNNLNIMIDTLPRLGTFIEIEGNANLIEKAKFLLNIKKEDVITENYFMLTLKKFKKPEDLLFEKFKKD